MMLVSMVFVYCFAMLLGRTRRSGHALFCSSPHCCSAAARAAVRRRQQRRSKQLPMTTSLQCFGAMLTIYIQVDGLQAAWAEVGGRGR